MTLQNTTPCRRPPKGTSKTELVARHKEKMMGKHFRNMERGVVSAPSKRKK